MKIVVIDGQGGRIGQICVEQLAKRLPAGHSLIAIGTNTMATAAMLKAGATQGATGENPVVVNCADADIVVGPMGILAANALLGEVTPKMAEAVGSCHGLKVLIPTALCSLFVAGTENLSLTDGINSAVNRVLTHIASTK